VDDSGNAYITGSTSSINFPTLNPFQASYRSLPNAFVTKLNSSGSALIYSTYLGGSGAPPPAPGDSGTAIAVDNSGSAYVTGWASSTDFPTTPSALQQSNHGSSYTAFVTKFSTDGSALIYSTYLGGSVADVGGGIAVDNSGNTYVAGSTRSTDFPTASPIQATNHSSQWNAFVAKLNASGSALVYSTYLGGTGYDVGGGIALDSSGSVYTTGYTTSSDFPTVNPIQATNNGVIAAFVAKLNAAGSALVYSTYLGGTNGNSFASGVAVDRSGDAYVTGVTASTDFPIANPIQAINRGEGDAFVAELNADGTGLVYSTYLGGSHADEGSGIAVDGSGSAYVTGATFSHDFPVYSPVQPANLGNDNAFVSKISPLILTTPTTP
jgi:hypothetical protein